MNITHYDVAIIGGGVAGMTAALYLKRANISCCIFEKNIPGGIINYTDQIENYPSYPNILSFSSKNKPIINNTTETS